MRGQMRAESSDSTCPAESGRHATVLPGVGNGVGQLGWGAAFADDAGGEAMHDQGVVVGVGQQDGPQRSSMASSTSSSSMSSLVVARASRMLIDAVGASTATTPAMCC